MIEEKTRLEIYLDVLKTVKSGKNEPPNIMCKCNLSWTPLKEILNSLAEQNLIRVNYQKNRRIYNITERGRQVLTYFKKVQKLLTIRRSAIHRHGERSLLEGRSFSNYRLPEIVIINIFRYYYYRSS